MSGYMVGLMLWFVVGFVLVVAGGGDDFGILLGPGWDPRELGDVCSWSLVVHRNGCCFRDGCPSRYSTAFPYYHMARRRLLTVSRIIC